VAPAETQVITRSLAESPGMPEVTGVRVTEVYTNSTAERAGIQVGDLNREAGRTPARPNRRI